MADETNKPLVARDLTYQVEAARLLDRVSLSAERGEFVGLVGPNGAGKTTLLRVLAGVYEPTHGIVRRDGHVSALFDATLGMDMEATGYENIILRSLFLGLSRREIHGRTEEITTFTELGDYLAMPVRTYSTGMLLRLAFAVSTCMEPEILLMDEWMAVGDAQFVEKAERRMDNLIGLSSILVIASHSRELIKRVCNKAILLDHGQVSTVGDVDEVLQTYEASN